MFYRICFNPLTVNDALQNYPSTTKAVNAVKLYVSLWVTLEPYSCLKGCYVSKLTGMTSHRAVVVSYQAPLGSVFWYPGEYSWL